MPSSLTTRQPVTAADWRRAVAEVKRKYVSRKYRACWTRCCELLDGLEDVATTEGLGQKREEGTSLAGILENEESNSPTLPSTEEGNDDIPVTTYRIYLHFYAASSYEMGARPLSTSSPFRGQLLRDARSHYDRAALLLEQAASNVEGNTQRTRSRSGSAASSLSVSSSTSSGSNSRVVENGKKMNAHQGSMTITFLNSPSVFSSSGSSRASMISTASSNSGSAPSSPRTSLCSSLDEKEAAAAAAHKCGTTAQEQLSKDQEQGQMKSQSIVVKGGSKRPLKKKKVSFSGLPELTDLELDVETPRAAANPSPEPGPVPEQESEGQVRPDSPTLGCWQHVVLRRPVRKSAFLRSASPSPVSANFPEPVPPLPPLPAALFTDKAGNDAKTPTTLSRSNSNNDKNTPTQQQHKKPTRKPTLARLDTATANSITKQSVRRGGKIEPLISPTTPTTPSARTADLDAFLETGSLGLAGAQLSALRSQVQSHRDAVDALLDVPDETPETPAIPSIPDLPSTARNTTHPNPNATTATGAGLNPSHLTSNTDRMSTMSNLSRISISAFPAVPVSAVAPTAPQLPSAPYSYARRGSEPAVSVTGNNSKNNNSRAFGPRLESSVERKEEGGDGRIHQEEEEAEIVSEPPAAPSTTSYANYPRPESRTLPYRRPETSMALSSPGAVAGMAINTSIAIATTTQGRGGHAPSPSCSYAYPSPSSTYHGRSSRSSYASSIFSSSHLSQSQTQSPQTPQTPYSPYGSRPSSAASVRGGPRDEALQQRIDRLRASGWQRKRFDTRRYEALREQVLGELGD